ncbi:hypothetical protein I79_014043 [Cricetulus griseus]|uniref:Uncharacterized protein n=1 Tax=Cricetulus griseus TaxID=10029 RepID=G3HT33_CRIGR|nr:hypothetical protein I79_014043 [Cricetulus griseus]
MREFPKSKRSKTKVKEVMFCCLKDNFNKETYPISVKIERMKAIRVGKCKAFLRVNKWLRFSYSALEELSYSVLN